MVRSSRTSTTTTITTSTTSTTSTSQTTPPVPPEASGLDILPEADRRKHHNSPIPIDNVVDTTTTTTRLRTKTEELLYEDELEKVRVEPVDKIGQNEAAIEAAFDYRHVCFLLGNLNIKTK